MTNSASKAGGTPCPLHSTSYCAGQLEVGAHENLRDITLRLEQSRTSVVSCRLTNIRSMCLMMLSSTGMNPSPGRSVSPSYASAHLDRARHTSTSSAGRGTSRSTSSTVSGSTSPREKASIVNVKLGIRDLMPSISFCKSKCGQDWSVHVCCGRGSDKECTWLSL
jgi:hypothetical protein